MAIVFNFYFTVSTKPVVTFREAAGLFRKTKFIMLWTAALNIVLSVILGKVIGLAGIILATSLSKLLTCFWYEPKLLFNDYFKKPCKLYFIEMLKGTVGIFISVCAAWLATMWLIPSSWLELILKGVIVAFVSVAVIFAFYHKTEGFQMIYNRGAMLVKNALRNSCF